MIGDDRIVEIDNKNISKQELIELLEIQSSTKSNFELIIENCE